jgi:hypothetical protein
MSRTYPSGGMFGIKLVGASHREFPFFGKDGKPTLMNFPKSPEGQRIASGIPIGHTSLVYLMAPVKRFWTAIEYIKCDPSIEDVLEEGWRAAAAQNAVAMMEAHNSKFAKIWRCVRVVALIDDPRNAPTPDLGFKEGDVMFDIEKPEFIDMFKAIPWSWMSNRMPSTLTGPPIGPTSNSDVHPLGE